MRLDPATPILADLVLDLGRARDDACGRAAELERLLRDLEGLHEPDTNGDCPTCRTTAPCVTHLLVRGQISAEQAYGVVRDNKVIDLVSADDARRPPVPSLAELLAVPTPSLDRFFDALLRGPVVSAE